MYLFYNEFHWCRFLRLSLELSESSARGPQAGINKGFKTFTIQLRAPPSWALKGTRDFVSLTLDHCDVLFRSFSPFSGCSLTEVHNIAPCLAFLPWPPVNFRNRFKIVLITYKAPAWSGCRSTFLNCWFILTLWDPQTEYCWWSQIRSNRPLLFRLLSCFLPVL